LQKLSNYFSGAFVERMITAISISHN